MGLFLLIVVILLCLGAFSGGVGGYWPAHYGYGGGGLGLILIVILIVLLLRGGL